MTARHALPDWPRMMKRRTAAAYLDLSEAELEREVAAGRLPVPVQLGKAEHWDRGALDKALEYLSGGGEGDWRSRSNLYRSAA